jgi:hypothetical protein
MAEDSVHRIVPVPASPDTEQDINPWSVAGAKDEHGRTLAIDYDKLSEYVASVMSVYSLSCSHALGSGTRSASTPTYSSDSNA